MSLKINVTVMRCNVQIPFNRLFVVTAVLLFSPSVWAQISSNIRTIEIRSKWWGLGPTGESSIRIEQHKGKFRTKDKTVDGKLVEQLLHEIEASCVSPTLENLAITDTWLQLNSESALPERLRKAPANERNLFLSSFREVHAIEKLLPEILRQGWTDDYPELEVRVVKDDGSTTGLASERQNIFRSLLPFATQKARGSVTTRT